jgi:hypothetical protein
MIGGESVSEYTTIRPELAHSLQAENSQNTVSE